jgi:ribosomal protein L11 methyltransferase
MSTRTFKEIRLRTLIDSGDLVALLDGRGCEGASESDGYTSLYWESDSWNEDALEALKTGLGRLGDPAAEATIEVSEIPDQDWNATWAASLQPVRLGSRILIRQSWNEAPAPEGGFALVVDPKRAFGTGYHATTQLIAEWLPELVRGGERVLDLGTGSGILAMIALRLGAGCAIGIDNGPEAIVCAREYAAVNGFGAELDLRVAGLGEWHASGFDLVLANLDRKTLLPNFAILHGYAAPHARLLISGLLRDDYAEVCAALSEAGWQVAERRDRDEWMALELKIGIGAAG